MGRKKLSFKQEPSSEGVPWWKQLYRRTGWRGKTLWDWQALLFVPVTIVLLAALLTQHQTIRQLQIEDRRAKVERELAEQRAQDEALQAYLDEMSALLLDKDRPLRQSKEGDEVRTLARARTVTILRRFDSSRNREILQFLREARLVPSNRYDVQGHIVKLDASDLSKANLSGANLDSFYLQGTDFSGADLRGAYLAWSFLRNAKLKSANMQGANLHGDTDLSEADLSNANMQGVNLSGDTVLSNADLSNANLTNANMQGANLTDVVLKDADLTDAEGVTEERLAEVKSLEGATMPNGQKYEEWLKDRERHKEDGENE